MKTDHLMWKEDGWGYLPANKDVFHTFEWIRHHYKPTKILEIGFYAGHSTTYMAQIFKEAHITSCCPDHPVVVRMVSCREYIGQCDCTPHTVT